jgi:hypothetical protein
MGSGGGPHMFQAVPCIWVALIDLIEAIFRYGLASLKSWRREGCMIWLPCCQGTALLAIGEGPV